ncbi:GNAT family N-acetyltransferase [Clostridium sp.]|uniref:GNAT family N-acetyltransferase n=1 Tax=Clostridium sp. TaxID=1506 RepID=UPI0032176102
MYENKVTNYENISSKKVFTIECKDIVLREFQLEDLDELYALTLQPEITDYLPDWIGSREEYENWVPNIYIKSNKEFFKAVPNVENHEMIVGIILKKTNEFIGWCCVCGNDDIPDCNTEIAYAISKHYRNKGYTTQAAKAMIQYLFEQTNIDALSALALKSNEPSNRVIQKCGFKFIDNIDIGKCEFNWYKLGKGQL